uniref:Uncharacterized protein n=2 Tax=Opuntia streptacantha TaxID=393608 RepID=A0A7C9ABJ1_OPUST
MRVVAQAQVIESHSLSPTDALGHILSCHFQVNTTWVATFLLMHIKEGSHFGQDSIKRPSLETTRSFNGISVHRVTDPSDNLSSPADSSNQMRKLHSHVFCSHPCDYSDSSRLILRVQNFNELNQLVWIHLVTNLYSKWVSNSS